MDYVRGVTLDHHVREHNLSMEETLQLFVLVCDAIQYSHQRGVIHRDLKPSNVIVDTEGTPRVVDFGLAKLLAGPEVTVVSVSDRVLGTLAYLSPEQARGNPDEVDTRTDVYSLGVVLYHLLTGQFPYDVRGSLPEVLRNITDTAPIPPTQTWSPSSGVKRRSAGSSVSHDCPIDDEVQTIILKAIAKELERRYQSAGDLSVMCSRAVGVVVPMPTLPALVL